MAHREMLDREFMVKRQDARDAEMRRREDARDKEAERRHNENLKLAKSAHWTQLVVIGIFVTVALVGGGIAAALIEGELWTPPGFHRQPSQTVAVTPEPTR